MDFRGPHGNWQRKLTTRTRGNLILVSVQGFGGRRLFFSAAKLQTTITRTYLVLPFSARRDGIEYRQWLWPWLVLHNAKDCALRGIKRNINLIKIFYRVKLAIADEATHLLLFFSWPPPAPPRVQKLNW